MDARQSEFFKVGGTFKHKDNRFASVSAPDGKHGFRITSFYKAVVEPRWDMSDPGQADIAEIMGEQNELVTRWYYSTPEEATHVSGSGVCGCLSKVEDIIMTGTVEGVWSEELLKSERESHARRIGEHNWHLCTKG